MHVVLLFKHNNGFPSYSESSLLPYGDNKALGVLTLLHLPLSSHLLSPVALRSNHTGLHATKLLLHGLCSCRSICLEWSSFTYLNGSFPPVSFLNITSSDLLYFTAIHKTAPPFSIMLNLIWCYFSSQHLLLHDVFVWQWLSDLNRCSMSAKTLFCSLKFLHNQKQCLTHAKISINVIKISLDISINIIPINSMIMAFCYKTLRKISLIHKNNFQLKISIFNQPFPERSTCIL